MKPELKAPGTMLLKLGYDAQLLNFAFKCNLRRYIKCSIAGTNFGEGITEIERSIAQRSGMGLHSSTFRLNVSALQGIGGACRGCLGGDSGLLGDTRGCLGCISSQKRLRLT